MSQRKKINQWMKPESSARSWSRQYLASFLFLTALLAQVIAEMVKGGHPSIADNAILSPAGYLLLVDG